MMQDGIAAIFMQGALDYPGMAEEELQQFSLSKQKNYCNNLYLETSPD
jgi:hypothetical protein